MAANSHGSDSPRSDARGSASDAFRRLHLWQIQGVRDVIFGLGVFAVFWLGYRLSAVTVPLLLGVLLAYLFEPLVRWLSRYRWCPRPVAAVGIITVVGGVLLLSLALAVPLAVGQAASLVETVRSGKLEQRVAVLIEKLPENYQGDARRGAGWIFGHPVGEATRDDETAADDAAASDERSDTDATATEDRDDAKPEVVHADIEVAAPPAARQPLMQLPRSAEAGGSMSLFDLAGSGLRTLYSVVIGTLALLLAVLLIPFYFYYFSVSWPTYLEFAGGLVPEESRPQVFRLVGKMDAAVAGFVRGRIVISVIMGTLLALGWLFVGVPYAILLGVITGVLCTVPYLGGVGLPLAVGLLALENAGVPEASRMGWAAVILWPSAVFAFVQTLEGYVLTPVIAGKATDLSPLAIFVAVLAGGALAGIYGMLISIPVAACLKILIVEVLLPRISAWTRGEVSDPLPVDNEP